jgi:hypothetical protein
MAEIACPKCGVRMPYALALEGREVFCLGCGSHFRVSDPAAAASHDDPSEPGQAATPNQPSGPNPKSIDPPSRQDHD